MIYLYEMKSIYKYILTLYIILYSSLHIFAYQGAFKSLSVSDGMTDLVVNSIYKDNNGFIWIGTNSSLEKFDGIRLKNYDIGSGKNKRVHAIIQSSNNELFCGSGMGIHKFDVLEDKFVRVFPETINCKVNAIFPFSADTLLVGTERGLYICTSGVARQLLFDNNLFSPRNNITSIQISSDSSLLWLSTMDGVISYSPLKEKFHIYSCDDSNLTNAFYNSAILEDYVYLGTMNKGLMRFNTRTHEFTGYVDVGCSVISSLSCDGKDLLYVGTDGNGVHFISVSRGEIIKSYRHVPGDSDGLRSNSVYSVLVDRDGLLWVGLYQMGVNYTLYQSGLFGVYAWKDKFTSKDMPVRTIAFNGKQRLIGSRDGLVFIDEARDIVKSYNVPDMRANMVISSCYYDGRFYIGTYGGGMYVLNPDNLELSDFLTTKEEPFYSGHIFCIRPDNEGNIWVGTSGGLYGFNKGKQVYHFTSSYSKLPEGNVYEIFFDSSHKGWVCTENGMCIWEPSTRSIKNDIFPPGFVNHEKIRFIYETSAKQLFFLPEKGKVFKSDISMNDFGYLSVISILDSKQPLSIIESDKGGEFVTTNNGLYWVDSLSNVIPFNLSDGIPSPIFINCTSLRDDDGIFWFGNSKGLVYLDSNKINMLHKHPYRINITNVLINGVETKLPLVKEKENVYSMEIDDSKRNISIQFSGLIYTDPSNMIYEYSINGNKWIPLHGTSEISLYDVKDDISLIIRRAGYPESQILFNINIVKNNLAYLFVLAAFFALIVLVYIFRRSVLKSTLGSLKRLVLILQKSESTKEDNTEEMETVQATADEDVSLETNETETENIIEEETIDTPEVHSESTEDKYKGNRLSDEECKRLLKILDKEMVKNKLYVNQSLKIADLANAANTSSHALSYLFNQYLQKTYYDYINEYRVEEFKSIIKKEKFSKFTLEALSEYCGFSSRASFFRSFKKVTGITPNEYIKNIKSEGKK